MNANASTVVIDDRDGHVLATLNNESGADEVWYNPGDGHYFLARSSAVGTRQFLGVVDAERLKEDTSVATTGKGTGIGNAHSVAADRVRNRIYFPIARPGAFARQPAATARMAASPYSPPRR